MSTVPFSAFVTINPDTLGAAGAGLALNGLLLTNSPRIPIGTVQTFASKASVQTYFGGTSPEASEANIYFNGFEGSNVKPGAMLAAQYPTASVSAFLRGGNISSISLAALQAMSGPLAITIDGVLKSSSINLSAATSFSNAALLIADGLAIEGVQAASFTGSIATTVLTVSAMTSGALAVGDVVKGAGLIAMTYIISLGTGTGGIGTYNLSDAQTVASEAMTANSPAVQFDSVSGGFTINSGTAGASSTITFATGALATSLLLTSSTGAVISQGAIASVPATFMNAIIAQTQKWASFWTGFNPDVSGNANKLLFAAWADSTNERYAYIGWDTDASPKASVPATSSLGYLIDQADYSGTFLIYEPSNLFQAAFVAGAVASVDFTQTNGRVTFDYLSQSGMTIGVDNLQDMNNLIANGYNCYVASAGAETDLNFLTDGHVSGKFLWMDTYINQIQMNNSFQNALMALMTTIKSFPYNQAGYSLIQQTLLDPINAALNFGTIRSGVPLSTQQASEVNNQAGANISNTLATQGWYLQILPASAAVRAARGSPPIRFWYMDGESIQKINMTSVAVQ